jgi:hypothetical protein
MASENKKDYSNKLHRYSQHKLFCIISVNFLYVKLYESFIVQQSILVGTF